MPHHWSLQKKLIAFSFAILIPLSLLTYYFIYEIISYARQYILSANSATAYVVAVSVEDFLQSSELMLTALTQSPVIQAQDPLATQQLLRDVYLTQRRFNNLFAADQDGVVYASVFLEEDKFPEIAGTQIFNRVSQTNDPVVATTRNSSITQEREAMVLLPLKKSDGNFAGLLGGTFSLGELKLSLTSIKTKQPISIVIVDADGQVIIHPDQRLVLEMANLSNMLPVRAVMQGRQGTMEYRDPSSGDTWVAAYTPISEVMWGVLVMSPLRHLFTDIEQMMVRNLMIFLFTLLLIILLILVLSRRILSPLRQLIGKIDTSLAHTAGAGSNGVDDELLKLSDAFDLLSSHLKKNVNELDVTKTKIQHQTNQLQLLLSRITQSKEEERRRIALDIHDGLAQYLVIALQETRLAEKLLPSDPESAIRKLSNTKELLAQSVAEADRVVFDLQPPRLGEFGLKPILQDQVALFEDFYDIPCNLEILGTPYELPLELALTTYRIIQEALHNIKKHAEPSFSQVTIHFEKGEFRATIFDNGKGFDQKKVFTDSKNNMGLLGMMERAKALGGNLKIKTEINLGTEIIFEVPI